MAWLPMCRRAMRSVLPSLQGTQAGAVHITGGAMSTPPFGGYKASGNGREGGAMGLEDFLETKMVQHALRAARDVSRWCPSRCLQFDL